MPLCLELPKRLATVGNRTLDKMDLCLILLSNAYILRTCEPFLKKVRKASPFPLAILSDILPLHFALGESSEAGDLPQV